MNIYVQPKNNNGSIEHYHHFLFGYFLPFIQNNPENSSTFFFDNCGPMNRHILDMPHFKTQIINSAININKYMFNYGFDGGNYRNINISKIREIMFDIYSINNKSKDNSILLIDRDKPDEFYMTKAKIKGSGSSRRHIPNINDIYEYLLTKKLQVKKIFLETLSIKDQINLFKEASTVICQHGASMSNLIWCDPATQVIEIRTNNNHTCFNKLINLCSLKYKNILQNNFFSPISPQVVYNTLTSFN
jgi:nitrogen regulatory protein PII